MFSCKKDTFFLNFLFLIDTMVPFIVCFQLDTCYKDLLGIVSVKFFIHSQEIDGIPEFLDSERKSWTLDAGGWTLDPGQCC